MDAMPTLGWLRQRIYRFGDAYGGLRQRNYYLGDRKVLFFN
ncbi:hypothetical protein [Nostoc sp. CHAB 5715]|nr:hypothetical protein [Nostoc sp. CHAB 5715]